MVIFIYNFPYLISIFNSRDLTPHHPRPSWHASDTPDRQFTSLLENLSRIFQKYTRRKVRTYVIEIQWWKGVKRWLILLGKLRGIAKQRHDQRLEKNTSNEASEMSETFPGTTQSLNSSTCTNEWLFSCTIFHFLPPFSTHDIIIRQLYSHHVGRKREKRRARRPKIGRNQQLRFKEYALCALVLIDPSFIVDIIS